MQHVVLYKFIMSKEMTSDDLAKTIKNFELTNPEFGVLVRSSTRAVNSWLAGEREIPGPVFAFVELLTSLPDNIRKARLERVRKAGQVNHDGLYAVSINALYGDAQGMLLLQRGALIGSDGVVSYDGTYRINSEDRDLIDIELSVAVPKGAQTILGITPKLKTFSFDVRFSISGSKGNSVDIDTQFGNVTADFRFLRALPV
jgi:hypothetical protein